jgi:two-component system, chemotaxis family, chemotaxis protein CheY
VSESTNPAGPNVLIVDDSAMMRAMIKRVALLGGVPLGTVHEAANGREALDVLASQRVHVLFTDINMPTMTGPELLREIRQRGEWPNLISVVVSTDGSQARHDEMQDLNVECFVTKPFPPEVMRDVLSKALNHV